MKKIGFIEKIKEIKKVLKKGLKNDKRTSSSTN